MIDLAPLASVLTASWLGWSAVDLPLFIALPVLLIGSGFFSGAETALFGMTEHERQQLRRSGSLAGRAVLSLHADQRMLLITILMGNMTINVLFFVISSVLIMHATANAAGQLALALGFLLVIVIGGEVLPKMMASAGRPAFASVVGPLLYGLHRSIGPLRLVVNYAVITPLTRLTAPSAKPPRLSEDELRSLLESAGAQGVIDAGEQRLLGEVLELRRLKVRDAMTPRVRMHAVEVHASREEVIELARVSRLTRLPVYRSNLDHIIGILDVRGFLLDARRRHVTRRDVLQPALYVPQVATLDKLLDHFRRTNTESAIVVDEYGGTAGVVAIVDVIEELVGEIPGSAQRQPEPACRIAPHRWRVDGNASVHEWPGLLGTEVVPSRVSTIGGLIIERLGRAPQPGDVVDVGNIRLEVETIDGPRVASAIVSVQPDEGEPDAEAPS